METQVFNLLLFFLFISKIPEDNYNPGDMTIRISDRGSAVLNGNRPAVF